MLMRSYLCNNIIFVKKNVKICQNNTGRLNSKSQKSTSPYDFRFRRAKGLAVQKNFLAFSNWIQLPVFSEDLRRQLWNKTHRFTFTENQTSREYTVKGFMWEINTYRWRIRMCWRGWFHVCWRPGTGRWQCLQRWPHWESVMRLLSRLVWGPYQLLFKISTLLVHLKCPRMCEKRYSAGFVL